MFDNEEQTMTPYELFKEKFDLPFNQYIDAMMSVIMGKPILDPFKFDDWLHEKYGNYEESGHSMYTLLIEHYGQETADQIRGLLG